MLDLHLVANIEEARRGLAARCANLCHHLVKLTASSDAIGGQIGGRNAEVRHDYLGTLARQALTNRLTQALASARARHERDLAFQSFQFRLLGITAIISRANASKLPDELR